LLSPASIAAFALSSSENANISNFACSYPRREAGTRTSPGRWSALMKCRRTPRLVLLAPADTPEHALRHCPTVAIPARVQGLSSYPTDRPHALAPLDVAKDTPLRSTIGRC
ncbi:hypothetical protein GGF50DRAFT_57467, partial [Schizophyllum commune]